VHLNFNQEVAKFVVQDTLTLCSNEVHQLKCTVYTTHCLNTVLIGKLAQYETVLSNQTQYILSVVKSQNQLCWTNVVKYILKFGVIVNVEVETEPTLVPALQTYATFDQTKL
jgi:hypothetical protein